MIQMLQQARVPVNTGPALRRQAVHSALRMRLATPLWVSCLALTLLSSGCIIDVITFASQDVTLRVVRATTSEPVLDAHVTLAPADMSNQSALRFRSSAPTDSDGVTTIEVEYGACFRSLVSLVPCELDEQGMQGLRVSVDVSTDASVLKGILTLAENESLADDNLIVTIVEISPPL